MVIEYKILESFEPFLLGYCNCGCGKNLKTLTNHGEKITKFIHGHWVRTANRKGFNHPNYINGRTKDNDGYWRLTIPDYYRADDHGRIREHVYNFQEFHKCCMLPWGAIHHVDGNKEMNMPWNLKGMVEANHQSLHRLGKHIDTSDRICFNCGTDKTYIRPLDDTHKTLSLYWLHLPWDKVNWYCKRCSKNLMRKHKKFGSP